MTTRLDTKLDLQVPTTVRDLDNLYNAVKEHDQELAFALISIMIDRICLGCGTTDEPTSKTTVGLSSREVCKCGTQKWTFPR